MIDVNLINGIALAFEGDTVYSMYIRRHLILKGMTKPNKLHQEATKYVSAKAQAQLDFPHAGRRSPNGKRGRNLINGAAIPTVIPRLRMRMW